MAVGEDVEFGGLGGADADLELALIFRCIEFEAVADEGSFASSEFEIEVALIAGDVGGLTFGVPAFSLPAAAVEGEEEFAVVGVAFVDAFPSVGEAVAVGIGAGAFVFSVDAVAPDFAVAVGEEF